MGPVLLNKSENKLIYFGDTTEFVIGRSIDHHLSIPDSTISRTQCSIRKVPEGEWLIEDLSSFKTSLVNGTNVPGSGLYLKSGDVITFGTLRSWNLEFHSSIEDMPSTTKRRRAIDEASEPGSQESRRTEVSECSQPKKPRRKDSENYQAKYEAVLLEKANLTESVEDLRLKVKELEEAKENADDILVSSHLDRKLLHTDYEDSCTEIDRLVSERQVLLGEIQENIKKREAAEALAGTCGPSSQNSSAEIESSLILKTIEVEELKDELTEAKSKCEKAEQLAQDLTVKSEKIYNDAIAVIEQEFLCCVCSDLMYEPVTLNCRHTMCGDCLKEWKKKKKECPSCRTKIKTEVRPIMLDSFIDRIAPILGDEFVKKRQEAKNDRAAPRTPPPPPPSEYVPAAGPSHGGGRGRRGSRRGGRGGYNTNVYRGMPPGVQLPPLPPLPSSLNGAVIDLTNRSPVNSRRRNDSDQTDEDEDSDLNMLAVADLVDAVEAIDAFNDESYPFDDSDNFEDEYDESEVDDDDDEEVDEDEADSYGDDHDESEYFEDDAYSDEL